jgi:hypothetical protein
MVKVLYTFPWYIVVAKSLNPDQLKAISKTQIPDIAKTLSAAEVSFLVLTLADKDDKLRYNAFLLLHAHSKVAPSVYQFWTVLERKLSNDNSYQRSLGVMLIAENVRWDKDGRFAEVLGKFWACCIDEKFITARQTIQALVTVMQSTDKYDAAIKQGLLGLQFDQYKENQQSLLKRDVTKALEVTNKTNPDRLKAPSS